MHALYKLKDTLCKELEEYADRSQLDKNSLEVVDTLAHALKNIDKVIEYKEMDNYSEAMSREGYSRGTIEDGMGHYHWPQYTRYSERRSMDNGPRVSNRSYRGGSYRYSRDYSGNDMVEQLRDMMEEAPDEKTRKEIERLVQKMESM